jgi:multisubunit Na+/H+ antiporter MnhG subunit
MSLIRDVSASLRALDVTPRRLRKSALVVGAMLVALALLFFVRGRNPWLRDAAVAAGVTLIAAGALVPSLLRTPYRIWMAFALALGWLVSRAVLMALFALVLTPIAVLARLSGKRFLDLESDPSASTYWVPHQQRSRYEKMY